MSSTQSVTSKELVDALQQSAANTRAKNSTTAKQPPPHLQGANENADVSKPQFTVSAHAELGKWFAAHNVSLVLTAYKSNLVFTVGATDTQMLGVFYSVYPHPMAVCAADTSDDVWLGTQNHLVRLAPVDRVYNEGSEAAGGGGNFTQTLVARTLHAIGPQDVHGIQVATNDDADSPYFVSTKFSALCRLQPREPSVTTNALWTPPFISELRAEDRCHMNSLALIDAKPAYVTCLCESDALDGWRDWRESGGVLVDVVNNEICARNLSMPHSVTVRNGEVWLLNSGTGHLGTIDFTKDNVNERFVPKVWLPGFLRGLQFVGRYAIVGSSLDRHEARFKGLPLSAEFERRKTTPVCGFFIVDTATWTIVHKFELKGNIHEVYDVAVLRNGGRRARILGMNDAASMEMYKIADHIFGGNEHPTTTTDEVEAAKNRE